MELVSKNVLIIMEMMLLLQVQEMQQVKVVGFLLFRLMDNTQYLFTSYYYISGCQFNCQQNQECQVWTFNSMSGGKGNNCWLKTSDAFMSYSCNRISGPKYCGKKI